MAKEAILATFESRRACNAVFVRKSVQLGCGALQRRALQKERVAGWLSRLLLMYRCSMSTKDYSNQYLPTLTEGTA